MAATTRRRTASPRRRYSYRCSVPVLAVKQHPPRGAVTGSLEHLGGMEVLITGSRVVRYAIEWDTDDLERIVRQAARNKSRKSTSGPITVYIHPED